MCIPQVLSDLADVLLDSASGKMLGGFALTEVARKTKLRVVLDLFNTALNLPPEEVNWTVSCEDKVFVASS